MQTIAALPPTNETLKIHDLTPIEIYDGIIYKRDDKYMPFQDVPISGGKVRQMACLMLNNYDIIKNECNSLVASGTSVNSPQGVVVSRTAKEFGFNSLIVFGATKKETLMKNIMVQWVLYSGAKLDYECKIGYENALNRRINEIKKAEDGKLFHVKFGINLESDPDAIIKSVAYQVQNIPDNLDNLIIPTGSAITAGGILYGLKQYNIKPKKVIIVQIAGYNREKTLRKIFDILDINPDYEYIADTTYPYSKQLKIAFNQDNEMLDPVYEAKAFVWMVKNVYYENGRTLFWLVGNSLDVRTISPNKYNLKRM